MNILALWLLYSIFGTTLFAAAFFWAVRSRQFHDSERARHLPLQAAESWSPETARPGGRGRASLLVMAAVLLALCAVALAGAWIALAVPGA